MNNDAEDFPFLEWEENSTKENEVTKDIKEEKINETKEKNIVRRTAIKLPVKIDDDKIK